jgi:hypothetical protein
MIEEDATAVLNGNSLSCEGTNINQIGDILADALLLFPMKVEFGWVSLGVWLQAKAVYNRYKDQLHALDRVELSGHSLGAGIALLVGYQLITNDYEGRIKISCCGGVKCISRSLVKWLALRTKTIWRVRFRDPIPWLGWWSMPELVKYEGEPKRHIFDYSIKEHISY